jgi:pimeloyl-ACP methyl ester carboxylesterase
VRTISFFLLAFVACHRAAPLPRATAEPETATVPTPVSAPTPQPIRVDEVTIPGDLPVFALRGNPSHFERYVFLGGRCMHPEGFIMSFAHAAANHGDLVTLQGDVPCGGPFRRWSYDFPSVEKRIDAALTASGIESRDVTLIGYSQGAEIAERLAAMYPDKFTRVILMSSPIVPSPERLRRIDGAVLMAGTRESQSNMRAGLQALARAKIRSVFQPIPNAQHGQIGSTPDDTMEGAFEWLEENSQVRVTSADLAR